MTPSEMLLKYKETGSAEFLGELEGEDLWAFLAADRWEIIGRPFEIYDYDVLHSHVVEEKRREYLAEVDVWMNEHAGIQYIRAHRGEWRQDPQKYFSEIFDAIMEL